METLARQEQPPALGRSLAKLAKEGYGLIRLFQIESMVDGLPEGQSANGKVSVDASQAGREVRISIQSGKPLPSFDTKTTTIERNNAGQVTQIHQSVAYADAMGVQTHVSEYEYPQSPNGESIALSLGQVVKDLRLAKDLTQQAQ